GPRPARMRRAARTPVAVPAPAVRAAPTGWRQASLRLDGPLQVRDQLLAGRPGKDGDQLVALISPGVEDLLRRMRKQRDRHVLPLLHVVSLDVFLLACALRDQAQG